MPERPDTVKENISCFESLVNDSKQLFSEYFKNSEAFPEKKSTDKPYLIVSIAAQKLYLFKNKKTQAGYPISSAKKGTGSHSGSNQTPLGIHQISEKIGSDAPLASILKARKNQQIIAEILTTPNSKSTSDNITSRILWLDGLEKGLNKGTDENGINVDSHSRYIYIHGTDEEGRLGKAASHGCIRMANQDVIDLFNQVEIGCLVIITDL